jgi:hypothetical protein
MPSRVMLRGEATKWRLWILLIYLHSQGEIGFKNPVEVLCFCKGKTLHKRLTTLGYKVE